MKIPFPADEQPEDGATHRSAGLGSDTKKATMNIEHWTPTWCYAGRGDLGRRNDLLLRRLP